MLLLYFVALEGCNQGPHMGLASAVSLSYTPNPYKKNHLRLCLSVSSKKTSRNEALM